jgi:hypothetical protein
MLFAFTRRSPLLIHTSHGKLPASLVSLADARACKPNLLLMVVVVLIMDSTILVLRGGDSDLHHALVTACEGACHKRIQWLMTITNGSEEHG